MTTLNSSHETLRISQPNISSHLPILDSLRGIAALYVVLVHAEQIVAPDHEKIPSFLKNILSLFAFGHYSVDLFIVLSGFCLMLPVLRNGGFLRSSLKSFFLRRAQRILPPYYAALALSIGILLMLISAPSKGLGALAFPITTENILTHIFLIHDLFRSDVSKINSPLWSISVEWRIYFLFPLFVWAWRTWGGWKTVITTSGLSYLLFSILYKFPSFNSDAAGPSIHYLGLFTLGMLAAEIVFVESDWHKALIHHIPWTLISFVCLLFAIPSYQMIHAGGRTWVLADLIVGIASFSLLIATASFKSHPLNKILNWNPLVKIGGFSYSLYLIHVPLLQVFLQYICKPLQLSPSLEIYLVVFAGIPMIIAVSYIFFLVIEKPCLSRRGNALASKV